MKKLLIITTTNDLSLNLFFSYNISKKYNISVLLFEENLDNFVYFLENNTFDNYYIRDPFNADAQQIREKLEKIFELIPQEKFLDNTKTIEDVFFEDKWLQYQDFKDFIPETQILKNISDIDNPHYITKKRISSRAK